MEIKTLGTGERLMLCARMLSATPLESVRYKSLLVLPIPTSKDKKRITGTEFSFADAAELCDAATLAVGYSFPPELKALILRRGASIADAALDEPFLYENAVLTANAALGIILTDFKSSPEELSVGIIGYGRIGSQLASRLLFLGARVTVYTTRESVRLELGESGVGAQMLSEESDFSGLSLLINTAPARVMSEERLSALPAELRIMELASGENFFGSSRVERLPTLPERFYTKTSAALYKSYIIRKLRDSSGEVVL